MRIQDIEINVGQPDFSFTPVRRLEAKCEAASAFSGAPTIDEVNAKLREMAAGLGANAVVHVEYKSGVSMTSWRSIRGTGLAVNRLSDDMPCPVCAETIKRAALKCRFCGAEVPAEAHTAAPATSAGVSPSTLPTPAEQLEPLKTTNNPVWWIIVVIALILIIGMLASAE